MVGVGKKQFVTNILLQRLCHTDNIIYVCTGIHVTYCFRVPLWTAGYCSGCWRRYWTPRLTLTPSWNDWGWGTGPQINWPRISHPLPAVCNIYKHSYHISITRLASIKSKFNFSIWRNYVFFTQEALMQMCLLIDTVSKVSNVAHGPLVKKKIHHYVK